MPNKQDDIEIRSEEVQEILSHTPVWMIRWGNALFLSLIVLLLVISWFIKYPDIIVAEALITTQIPPQKEFANTTGKIEAILVKDNEKVDVGQPLAILENTANYNDVFALKAIIDTIKINTKSFYFPLDSLPILFLGNIESQFGLFENSYIQYRLNKELKPFSNESIANKFSVGELNRRLQSLKSQRAINKIELEFISKELSRNKSLFEKGVISAQYFENKQREYIQADRNYKNFESSISQIKEAISNAKRASKSTEINMIKEDVVLIKNVIQSFNQLKKAIKDWEYLYVLKSETKGVVSFLNYWNTNQSVNQGDLVFTIIPSENSSFIGKLKTPVRNSGKVKINQKVNIKLENYPEAEFGVLSGVVKKISITPDKEGFYVVDVELTEKLITSYDKSVNFRQGMTGEAAIITEDLRLIERFFYQFRNIIQ